MSRLDRLVRAAWPHLDDEEALLGSILGRVADERARAAVVATDRRVVVVIERFNGPEVRCFRYADITDLEREDVAGLARLSIVASTGRAAIDRIEADASARVVLQLLERRAEVAEERTIRTATAGTPGLRHGVRVQA